MSSLARPWSSRARLRRGPPRGHRDQPNRGRRRQRPARNADLASKPRPAPAPLTRRGGPRYLKACTSVRPRRRLVSARARRPESKAHARPKSRAQLPQQPMSRPGTCFTNRSRPQRRQIGLMGVRTQHTSRPTQAPPGPRPDPQAAAASLAAAGLAAEPRRLFEETDRRRVHARPSHRGRARRDTIFSSPLRSGPPTQQGRDHAYHERHHPALSPFSRGSARCPTGRAGWRPHAAGARAGDAGTGPPSHRVQAVGRGAGRCSPPWPSTRCLRGKVSKPKSRSAAQREQREIRGQDVLANANRHARPSQNRESRRGMHSAPKVERVLQRWRLGTETASLLRLVSRWARGPRRAKALASSGAARLAPTESGVGGETNEH